MVKIGFTGDFCPWQRIEKKYLDKNWKYLFDSVKPFFDNNDLNVIELECPLTNGGYKILKTGPYLKANPLTVEIISYLNCKLVATANNHIMDYGIEGLESTYQSLTNNNISWMGSGFNVEDASKIFVENINNLTFAFINVAESEWATTFGNEPGCNPIDLADIFNKINNVKNKVDFVIISVHGGHENYELPSPRMKKWYRFFVDAGANAVIAHHTHIISGYEVYKNAPIFYGLGNFCFDWRENCNKPWNIGMLVRLCFDKGENICFELEFVEQNNLIEGVYFLDDFAKQDCLKKISELNEIINNDELLDSKYSDYCETWNSTINNWLQPYSGAILPRLHKRGIIPNLLNNKKKLLLSNLARCESHRDILLKVLSNLMIS